MSQNHAAGPWGRYGLSTRGGGGGVVTKRRTGMRERTQGNVRTATGRAGSGEGNNEPVRHTRKMKRARARQAEQERERA